MNINNGGLGFAQTLNNEDFKRKLKESMQEVNNFSTKSYASMDHLQIKAKDLALTVGGIFTVGAATSFIQEMVKVRGEFEQTEIAFKTMLQSQDKSTKLMAEMVELAKNTPMQFSEVSQGAKQLLAYQVEAEKLTETLTMLGNISSGLSVPISRLILVYGQVRAKGKLMGDDLRQFTEAGVPMIAAIAKNMGVAQSAVAEMVSEGKVGFKDVEKVLEQLTSQGGLFYNMMEEQSKTIPGQIAKLQDEIEQMFNSIGKDSQGFVTSVISGASSVVENYKEIGNVLGLLIASYGIYKTALIANTVVLRTVQQLEVQNALAKMAGNTATSKATVLTLLQMKAQASLNAVMAINPYVMVAVALAGLASAYILLRDTTTEAEKAQEAYNETQNKVKEGIDETKKKAEEYINVLKDETATVYQQIQAYKALQELKLKGLENLTQEEIKLMDISELKKKINSASDENNLSAQKSELKRLEEEIKSKEQRLQSLRQGSVKDQYDASKLADNLKVITSQYNLQYDTVRKMEDEMQIANMTLDQKKAYWENIVTSTQLQLSEINKVKQQQNETKTILGVNLGLVNQTGNAFQMWNVSPLISQLEQAKTELSIINQSVGAESSTNKNKGFWEQQKKEASDARDALAYTQKGSKEWNELTKKINEANSALQAYNDSYTKPKTVKPTKVKTTKKADDPIEIFKKEVDQYKEQYDNLQKYLDTKDEGLTTAGEALRITLASKGQTYLEFLKAQQKQLMESAKTSELAKKKLDVINTEIYPLLNESLFNDFKINFDKQLNDAEYLIDKIKLINEEKAKLEGSTDQGSIDKMKFLNEKDNQNQLNVETYLKEEGEKFDQQYQYLKTMREEYDADMLLLQDRYNKSSNDAEKQRIQGLMALRASKYFEDTNGKFDSVEVNEILKEFKTLEQKKLDIASLYDGKKAKLRAEMSSNSTEDELKLLNDAIAEIERKQTEALKSVDKEILEKSEGWVQIFGDYANKSSTQLLKILDKIRSVLNDPDTAKNLSPEQLKALQDQFTAIKENLKKDNPFDSLKDSLKQFLSDFKNGFKDIDGKVSLDSLRGLINEIKGAIDATFETAEDLGIEISDSTKSAIQLGTELFDAGMQIAEGIASKNPIQIVQGVVSAIGSIIRAGDRKKERQIQQYKEAINQLTKAFQELEYASSKALGGDVYKNQKQMMDNLNQQNAEIDKMIKKEKDKKKTDKSKIDEWEQLKLDNIRKSKEIMENISQDILQTNAKDLANTLGDALVEAFGKGEDAAKSFEKVANDVLKNAILNQLKKRFLEQALQPILDDLEAQMGVSENGWSGLTPEQQQELRDRIKAVSENFTGALEAYSDLFKDIIDPNQDSLSGAVKGVSEETASLIAGQMNAIRIMQMESLEVHRNSNAILVQQLDQLFRIEFNTRNIVPELREIKTALTTNSTRAWGI